MIYQNCPIYIWSAPPENLRGGPEVLYLLCDRLRKNGRNAKMFGFSDYSINPVFSKIYDSEMCSFKEVNNATNCVIIVPEILIQDDTFNDKIFDFAKKNTLVIWYLSSEFTGVLNTTWGQIIEKIRLDNYQNNIYHCCESRFIFNLLGTYGINKNKFMLQHGTNDDIIKTPKTQKKEDLVFYNGYKTETREFVENIIMPKLPNVGFLGLLPENGYKTKTEICEMLDKCKVYIDVCGFGGRELMPREAALRDCILLLEDYRCASVYEDYPISNSYKLSLPLDSDEIAKKIIHNISYYEENIKDMAIMKNKCLMENNNFENQLRILFG